MSLVKMTPLLQIAVAFYLYIPLTSAALSTATNGTTTNGTNTNNTGTSAASTVDTAGFWVGFTLIVITSLVEATLSIFWTRIRIASDGVHPCELSCRVCGREVILSTIGVDEAETIASEGLPIGIHSGSYSSVSYSDGFSSSTMYSGSGCSTCGGIETKHSSVVNGATEVAIDKFGSIMLVPSLVIRRFNPTTSLQAPTGLVENMSALFHPADFSLGRILENLIHLMVGLLDVSLGIAGLALKPSGPKVLWDTLKDSEAPMTFDNYSTLFILWWILGVILTVFLIPLRSQRRSIQFFGLPATIAFLFATLASVLLFGLGCWKIDVARKASQPWTPMLSYWIGGASAISFPLCGIEVFHTFGVVGLAFMMMHTFQ